MITEQQRQERRLGIGGSDMPIILGLSSYKTPYQLYLEKIGQDVPRETSEEQYWGSLLESVIIDEFSKRNNVRVDIQQETLIHPVHDFMLANLDGFIPSLNAVLEVKCSSSFMSHEWGEEGSDVIPLPYLVQVAHYCAVTNADLAYIAVLIGGNKYKQFIYNRDHDLEIKIIDAAKKFWHYVQANIPPDPVNQVDLRLMYPKHAPEKCKSLTRSIAEKVNTLTGLRLQRKKLTQSEEESKFSIMRFMEDAEFLTDESGSTIISWRTNKRGSRTFLMKGV